MPVGQKYDYVLDGKGFMLYRQPGQGARSWLRTGKSDVPEQRAFSEEQYGVLPSDLERPVVWDDWSGGYGEAYRRLHRIGFHLAESNKYHWGFNFDTRFPKQLIHCQQFMTVAVGTVPTIVTTAFDVINTDLSSAQARGVAGEGQAFLPYNGGFVTLQPSLDASTTASWVSQTAQMVDRRGQGAVFGSFLYLPVMSASPFGLVGFDGAASLMSTPGAGFVNAGNRLWKWSGPTNHWNLAQSLAAGADAAATSNWSATLSIGHGLAPILRGISLKDTVYFGMSDGLYAGDYSGSFYNVLPDLEHQPHPDNCRDLTVFQGEIIAPHMSGIYSYQPSTTTPRAREIGPMSHSNRSPIRGRIRAVKAYGPWLYAGITDGSQSYLLAGRPFNDPITGEDFQWHVLHRLPVSSQIARIAFDSVTIGRFTGTAIPARMYAQTELGPGGVGPALSDQTLFCPIPPANDNPLNALPPFTANYVGSASIYLGQVDFQAPMTPKIFRSLEVTADNLASGYVYANAYYAVDGGARTLLGLVATSPKSTLFFPNGSGNWVGGQAIELSIDSFTSTQSLTPVYRSMVLRGSLRPRSVDLITATTRIADRMHDRQQAEMRPAMMQIGELRALALSGYPCQLTDIAGATQWVNVLEPVEEHEIWQEGSDTPELIAMVKMAVMKFSLGG